jgi:VIT1/CCC1 family predicted Fe2+/Mn2+ transporter
MTATDQSDKARASRYRKYLKSELSAMALYSSLAGIESDPERSHVFQDLKDSELRHAEVWAGKLGMDEMPFGSLGTVGLLCVAVAKLFGTNAVIPLLLWEEAGELRDYYPDPEAKDVAKDERHHERVLKGLARGQTTPVPIWEEGQSATSASGNLRAAVLGVNDGLVSNFSLVMGVSGGTDNADFVLLAGIAGLLAGAFSMAAGEYVSMRSQRDIYEHELRKEKIKIRDWPDEEQYKLELVYRAKGLTEDEARLIAKRLMSDPKVALDTMAREELGLDPDELGSPWGAAFASLAAFFGGAITPILPFLFNTGNGTVVSAILSALALLVVGGFLAVMSGNRPYWGALRMLFVGSAAATVTYGIGSLIGVSVAELG